VTKQHLQPRLLSALLVGLALVVTGASAGPVQDGEAAYQKGDYETALKLWRPLAENGDAEAQRSLGWMYGTGHGVPRDQEQATVWYRKAAEQGDARAQNRLGMTYIYGRKPTADDVAVGLSWFEKAAYQGDVASQRTLGELHEFGDFGIPRDHAQSVAWFRMAAKQDDVGSMHRLIGFAANANDYVEVAKWSRRLAELGNSFGQYEIGLLYAEGKGVPKDQTQALEWLQKAASQHDFNASLARKYLEQLNNPGPTPPPPDFDAIRRKAEEGNAEAQNKLGELYHDPKSVLKDDAQAVAWFRKAAEQGYAAAESNLADMYFEGKGVPPDQELHVYWLRRAAEHGDASSQLALSRMYFNGIFGVQRDDALGLRWLTKAANAGYAAALRDMALAYDLGRKGVSKDRAKAAYWYEEAAERGDVQSQYFLAERYESGDGVVKDIDKAIFWMRKAADHNEGDFMQNLAAQALPRLEKSRAPQQERDRPHAPN
jgi:TPR repeat protein